MKTLRQKHEAVLLETLIQHTRILRGSTDPEKAWVAAAYERRFSTRLDKIQGKNRQRPEAQ